MRHLILWGLIYNISYDLSSDYLKVIVRWTYDIDLQRGKISDKNIVSWFTNTTLDDLTILRVNRTYLVSVFYFQFFSCFYTF